MTRLSTEDQQHVSQLLSPSWLSVLIAVTVGLVVTVGVIVAFNVNNSGVQQQLVAWEQTRPTQALTTPSQNLPTNDAPTLQGSWPLLLAWSLVGLVAYGVVTALIRSINQAAALRKSLNYVNAKPRSILETTAKHLAARLVALIALIVLAILFVKRAIPYGITAAHASAANVLSPSGLLDALLAFAVTALTLHLLTIFLRLSLGRIRVFSNL